MLKLCLEIILLNNCNNTVAHRIGIIWGEYIQLKKITDGPHIMSGRFQNLQTLVGPKSPYALHHSHRNFGCLKNESWSELYKNKALKIRTVFCTLQRHGTSKKRIRQNFFLYVLWSFFTTWTDFDLFFWWNTIRMVSYKFSQVLI